MSTSTEPTTLATSNRRGIEADLTTPLPSALAATVPERAAQHQRVADS